MNSDDDKLITRIFPSISRRSSEIMQNTIDKQTRRGFSQMIKPLTTAHLEEMLTLMLDPNGSDKVFASLIKDELYRRYIKVARKGYAYKGQNADILSTLTKSSEVFYDVWIDNYEKMPRKEADFLARRASNAVLIQHPHFQAFVK